MRILLINLSIREYQPPYVFPSGLGLIAAILRQAGNDVHVYDQNALRSTDENMCRNLKKFKNIDIVGLGGLITLYGHLKRVLPDIRGIFPNAKIVMGGGVTVEPEVIFGNMPIDFCVHGDGEQTFTELCDALEKQRLNFSDIAGISYIKNDKIIKTESRLIEQNLDQFPMPAYDLFPAEIYFENNVIKNHVYINCGTQMCGTLLWSRGCPNQCTFCWRMSGKTVRFRSTDLIMDEIQYLKSKYRIDSYLFVDECINADRRRSIDFATQLIERGHSAPWYSHACVTNFDSELANLFKQSGCVGLNFGVESGSPLMLSRMKKHASPQKAAATVAIAKENNIVPVCTFIVGTPGETKATIRDSIRWIRKNRVHRHPFSFTTPYPGCELYYDPLVQSRIKEKYGTKDAFFCDLGDISELSVNMTDFTDSELIGLRKWADSASFGVLWEARIFIKRLCALLRQPNRWGGVLRNRLKLIGKIIFCL